MFAFLIEKLSTRADGVHFIAQLRITIFFSNCVGLRYVYIYIYIYRHKSLSLYRYIERDICVSIYIYIYIYIYIHIYIYRSHSAAFNYNGLSTPSLRVDGFFYCQ